jgi:hypothetical protein
MGRHVPAVGAVQEDTPFPGVQVGEGAKQKGLAGPRGTGQGHALPWGQRKVHGAHVTAGEPSDLEAGSVLHGRIPERWRFALSIDRGRRYHNVKGRPDRTGF